jgi:GAF domain-containing protein
MRRGAKPAKAKAKAARPLARTPQKTEGSRTRELEKRLAEALEQQAATSEILRIISGSPMDLQSVLDIVAERAARLCNASDAQVFRIEADALRLAAHHGPIPVTTLARERGVPIVRGAVTGRAVVDRQTIHVHDVAAELDTEYPDARQYQQLVGFRTALATPLLREGVPLGAILIRRMEVRPFSEEQIALLKTFAAQAAIAIENVRLFKELEARNLDLTEALEQQTATAAILRVISSSPTDLQPVLDTVVKSAARFCGAYDAQMWHLDGGSLRIAAHHGPIPSPVGHLFPVVRATVNGRSVLERRAVHVSDLQAETEEFPEGSVAARETGSRTALSVPMLREGTAIGAINLRRLEVNPFTDRQIALLQTFADQAVIAVENVRLFKELEARNRDLTEALEQQTATSEILHVISRSQTDVQPVFDTIVRSAVRLCDGLFSALFQFDGELLHHVAQNYITPEGLEEVHRIYPTRPTRALGVGRAILERAVVHIPDVELDPEFQHLALSRAIGFRSGLFVPMLREGAPIGVIAVTRAEAGPFSDNEIELLKTFADQAVIAVENVRLFKELEARNADLTEALEQQTATSEILRVISSSPTDLQPVLDAVAENAARVCGAHDAVIFRIDGDVLQPVAVHGPLPAVSLPLRRGSITGRAVVDRQTIHVEDLVTVSESEFPDAVAAQRRRGHRTTLATPLLREGLPLGAILIRRMEVRPFTEKQIALLKTFADQAVIAIENVRLFSELQTRNSQLTEALEQQTATSEILRVISQSQTDVQPVFDTIVRSAVRLCDGLFSALYQFDGELIHHVAHHNYTPEALEEVRRIFPARPNRGLGTGRAILERAVVHIPDVQVDPEYQHSDLYRAVGFRSGLWVPMLREGAPIGVIVVARAEPGAFSNNEIELLKTFADQAVIAVENVRLFKELEARNRDLTESLDQQTATSEILGVISSSPTDIQPVFDTIMRSAVRLSGARFGSILRFDGEMVHFVTQHGSDPDAVEIFQRMFPMRPDRGVFGARSILDRAVVQVPDVFQDAEFQGKDLALASGWSSAIAVPMLREGTPIGAIVISKTEPGLFPDGQVALLQTFADQAVIAVENVRLFKELEARNRDLTEALEQQTATAEILRVISRSQTDVQPVFDTIVRSAVKLCDGLSSVLFQFDGELIHLVAQHNYTPEAFAAAHRIFPARPTRALGTGRAILERAVVHMPDVELDPEFQNQALSAARAIGYRSGLWVPMLREGAPIGVIVVTRAEPGPFSESEIELLKTFADQAVIAVENVRLFKELQARTGELTQSVEKLTALGEVSRAVSSTLDVETVLNTIVSRASQLAGAAGCSIFEYDAAAERFELRATHNDDTEFVEALRAVPLRKGEGLMGRAAQMREPIQIPDITQPGAYQSSVRDTLIRFGYRALLSVPLLREDQIIGSLSFNRKAPGEFPPEVVDVLKTFATQSALAVQNARLFREIADKSAQLEAASRHKSEFLANMSHELRTPLNAIIGFSEILAEKMFGDINEKQTEYLQDILESGRHLLSLINDILDLSKIEAGRMELERSEFDLPNAIENALILVRERANRRGVKLASTIDKRLGMIGGDERKVKQVLLNLLSNALKFTPEGGRIDVGASLHDEVAEVSVADTGIGIAPADQDAVFEEFRQVGTADKKAEGTGLGLALSRKFIELHGGRIWVKSELGTGSTFTFTLPVAKGE